MECFKEATVQKGWVALYRVGIHDDKHTSQLFALTAVKWNSTTGDGAIAVTCSIMQSLVHTGDNLRSQ